MYRALEPVPVFAVLGGMFGMFGFVHVFRRFPSWPLEWQILSIVGIVLLFIVPAAIGVRRLRMLNRQGRFIAITGDGLLIRMEHLEPEFIPWSNISRASATTTRRMATLFIKDQKLVRHVGGVFKTREDTQRFVRQVQERVRAANEDAS